MVNREGKRFTNEAGNYNAMGGVFHAFDPQKFEYPNNPCWLIFDHKHKLSYDVAGCPAGDNAPDWMLKAETVEELASLISVDSDTFASTLNVSMNSHLKEKTQISKEDKALMTLLMVTSHKKELARHSSLSQPRHIMPSRLKVGHLERMEGLKQMLIVGCFR